ncbi:MAG: hypothetical protein OXG36_03175 [Caldilineaceae bacterium]|nr:hypothetical protein [Caldilineaceae bacterium]
MKDESILSSDRNWTRNAGTGRMVHALSPQGLEILAVLARTHPRPLMARSMV